jgi:hypothetical protein
MPTPKMPFGGVLYAAMGELFSAAGGRVLEPASVRRRKSIDRQIMEK